jgi:hypothetical protein
MRPFLMKTTNVITPANHADFRFLVGALLALTVVLTFVFILHLT